MKIKQCLLSISLVIMLLFAFSACASSEEESLAFTSNDDGTCSVSGIGSQTSKDIVIPTVAPNGDRVISINNYAFKSCSSLESITIPDSVSRIGDYAFYRCTSLKTVNIPDSVKTLGNGIFYDCQSLSSITIPTGITAIGNEMFFGCTSLRYITIPNSVTTIEARAFYGCNALTALTLPSDLTAIGKSAFYGCHALTSLIIPDSLTYFGADAFYHCTNLKKLYISDLSAWCTSKFLNKNANPLCYANNLYIRNELATHLLIPQDVTEIGDFVFAHATSIKSVTFHGDMTYIGISAFYGCNELSDVYFTVPQSELTALSIAGVNDSLKQATIHYPEQVD